MNAAETNIMGMLHSQVILARSKELFADRSQTQGQSIDITVMKNCHGKVWIVYCFIRNDINRLKEGGLGTAAVS